MKSPDLIYKFTELRGLGFTYQHICSELGISKSTAIRWSKDHSDEVSNIRAIEMERIQESFLLTKKARIEALGELSLKIYNKIMNIDLDHVPADKLMDMLLKSLSKLDQERMPTSFQETAVKTIDDPVDQYVQTEQLTWTG